MGSWDRLNPAARMAHAIAAESVPFPWFQSWRSRLASLDVALQVFMLETFIGIPAFKCVIGGSEEFGSAWRRFSGTAAHGDPEIALFRALAEAIQSRLTLIAGVRDDIMPAYYASPRLKPAEGNGDARHRIWRQQEALDLGVEAIAERLAARGYRQIAFKRLDADLDGIAVTKIFVPGLGSSRRTRRDTR